MVGAWQVLHEESLVNLILTADARSAKHAVYRHAQRIHGHNGLKRCDELHDLINHVPVINKAALQDKLKNENWLIKSLLYSETSGTTGMPLPTPRGKEDLHWNAMNQAYAYRRFLNPGDDRVAILHPSILSPFVEASAMALQMLNTGYVRIYPIPEICDYSRLYDVIDRYAVTTIMSTPSLACKLLYEFMRQKGGIPCSLKKLLLTGEPLGTASKENFQRIIGVDNKTLIAPFVYGSSEIATVMHGKKDGSFEPILEDFVFELRENTDFPGSYRLILTWLREGVMPILRYDTNDYFMFNGDIKSPSLRFLGRAPPGSRGSQGRRKNRKHNILAGRAGLPF